MPRNPSAEERQRNSPQQHNPFAPMLPFNPADAEMTGSPTFFTPQNATVRRQMSQSPYPGASDAFQNDGMSPATMARPTVHRGAIANSPYARAEFKLPKAHHPLPPGRSPLWPTYSPGYNAPFHQMHSRLPPNNVARKAPRKATAASSSQQGPLQRSNSKAKSTQSRKVKREDSLNGELSCTPQPGEGAQGGQRKRLKTAHRTLGKASIPAPGPPNLPSASARGRRRVVLDDEDDENGDVNEVNIPIPSIELDTLETAASATRAVQNLRRLRGIRRQHPRPRYNYIVSKKLEAIKQALGDEDWDGYLIATEEKFWGKITKGEFDVRSKRMFMVFDEQTRWRVERLVDNLVEPVVKEHAAKEAEVQMV